MNEEELKNCFDQLFSLLDVLLNTASQQSLRLEELAAKLDALKQEDKSTAKWS